MSKHATYHATMAALKKEDTVCEEEQNAFKNNS